MDYVQALFSFFISPLLGVVLMGMFWKRATKAGGFWGLLFGTSAPSASGPGSRSIRQRCAMSRSRPTPRHGGEYVPRALVGSSLPCSSHSRQPVDKPRPEAELNGLVYGATILPKEEPVPFYKNEWMWAGIAIVFFAALTSTSGSELFSADARSIFEEAGRKESRHMQSSEIPIWFFIGVLLVVYGAMILGYGFLSGRPELSARVS